MSAIGIRLHPPTDDPAESRLFGAPCLTSELLREIGEDEIFIAQVRLCDIAEYDTAGQLPHEGYLYFFITAGEGARCMPSGDMRARVRYSAVSPTTVVDDFNDASPAGEGLGRGYALAFVSVADDAGGMKLLGTPAGWAGDAPGRLLLQYDPYEAPVPFLSHMDGYAYFFFPPSDDARVGTPPRNFDRATFTACYS